MSVRVGQGFDVHAFSDDPARVLVLGGVEFPGERGLVGHSDADAIAHACADALLGAAGLGDIGQHFPDTDPRFKDADSIQLLRTVVTYLGERGFAIGNVDATIVLERPKLAPHREAIRDALAGALGLPAGAVNVKATTGERMGFVGRGEGAAAMAIATLERRA